MSDFRSQTSAHNWLKQGKVIFDTVAGGPAYYKVIDGYLQVYGVSHTWVRCRGRLEHWFMPKDHPHMKKSKLKDIPNYTGAIDKYTPPFLFNACRMDLRKR